MNRSPNESIRWVASSLMNRQEFQERARQAAQDLGPGAILPLSLQFHSEHTPPPELAAQFRGLGDWMAARQFAIFEMFYHFREAALPTLRRIAFGEYDWTQGNAIEILCRLAAEGIEREQLIEDLKREVPEMREEAIHYALEPLKFQAETDPQIAELLKELYTIEDIANCLDED